MVAKVAYPLFGFPAYAADLRGAPVGDDIKEEARKDAIQVLGELFDAMQSEFMAGPFCCGDKQPLLIFALHPRLSFWMWLHTPCRNGHANS